MNDSTSHGPWNPGIQSPVPHRLRHLCTVFRRESSFTRYEEARELHGFTGLDYVELVAFRPERLSLHEVLIRVSADLTVPDGEKIEDTADRKTLERIHQLRDCPIRIREGDAVGYGIFESVLVGNWPEFGLSGENSFI